MRTWAVSATGSRRCHNENDVTMIIAGLWRYGDWRHVAMCCNALVSINSLTRYTTQQQRPFYGPLSGTTRVSRYQKKHSPTHHPDHHPIFISFFHLPWSIASSLFTLPSWQSFCTTSFHVLFGLPLGLEPSTSTLTRKFVSPNVKSSHEFVRQQTSICSHSFSLKVFGNRSVRLDRTWIRFSVKLVKSPSSSSSGRTAVCTIDISIWNPEMNCIKPKTTVRTVSDNATWSHITEHHWTVQNKNSQCFKISRHPTLFEWVTEWVSSFLTAHQHIIDYSVP